MRAPDPNLVFFLGGSMVGECKSAQSEGVQFCQLASVRGGSHLALCRDRPQAVARAYTGAILVPHPTTTTG